MPMNILILTADAGFGHRRAAQAVEAALLERYGEDCIVDVVNPIEDPDVPKFLRQAESDYDRMVIEEPGLYLLSYKASDTPPVARAMQDVTAVALHQTLIKVVGSHRPDAIISTYPAYTQAVVWVLREQDSPVINAVVITDLIDVHDLWFHKKASLTFAPTRYVYEQALARGLPADRVYLSGLPVHPDIARETRDKGTIRTALAWDPYMTTAVIVGSARSRHTAIIARLLDQSGLDLQIAVVSGGAAEVDEELQNTEWQGTVHVYGKVKNLPEMMHAADFIICKAGGLIVSEALACGLPLILYEALPGQEAGNVRYVVESGAGVWAPGPVGALAATYAWLAGDGEDLETCRAAAKRAGRPRAAHEIAEQVYRRIQKAGQS
jgi:1,2-diacylglycerol 3-beta-galactosyltransferase